MTSWTKKWINHDRQTRQNQRTNHAGAKRHQSPSEYQNDPTAGDDAPFNRAINYWHELPTNLIYFGAVDPSLGKAGSSRDPTAYAAGQWERIQQTKEFLPYLQYMPSLSENKRDSHQRYYGLVRPVDDPIWASLMPPNDFGCKCWIKQITKSEAKRQGISEPGFAHAVFDSIHPTLIKHLSKEQMTDIANDVEFFSELDLSELDKDGFNMAFMAIKQLTSLDKHWQSVLLKAMQVDPRYTP